MDHLPLSDIPMLVSTINFLLSDEIFENLDQICYCFNVEREEMDHIEDCIANYANSMSKELFNELSQGNPAFLHEHTTFQDDLTKAARVMEKWLEFKTSFSFTLTISPFHGHSFSVPLTFEELSPSSSYILKNPFLSFEEIRKFVMF